jgi:hypothetical protein
MRCGTTATNPERVTLALREPGRFGKEITFSPARRFLAFARSPVINELIERVDAARGGSLQGGGAVATARTCQGIRYSRLR